VSSKANIDKRTGLLWDSHWRDIEQTRANKKLVLVEGDDDKLVVEALLRWRDPLFESKVYVGVAGDRTKVLNRLKKDPLCYGLVDRDTWDDADIRVVQATRPRLEVTRGWCIENHFCAPSVLAVTLSIDESMLRNAIDPLFSGWYRYGAIWRVVQRARVHLNESWPTSDCGHPIKDPCLDELALRKRFASYAAVRPGVDVDNILKEVNQRIAAVAALPSEQERIDEAIHGKQFFKEVIAGALNDLLGQRDTETWRVRVADGLAQHWPQYLVDLADVLLKP
jgi:hypothetical protein